MLRRRHPALPLFRARWQWQLWHSWVSSSGDKSLDGKLLSSVKQQQNRCCPSRKRLRTSGTSLTTQLKIICKNPKAVQRECTFTETVLDCFYHFSFSYKSVEDLSLMNFEEQNPLSFFFGVKKNPNPKVSKTNMRLQQTELNKSSGFLSKAFFSSENILFLLQSSARKQCSGKHKEEEIWIRNSETSKDPQLFWLTPTAEASCEPHVSFVMYICNKTLTLEVSQEIIFHDPAGGTIASS